MAKAKTRKQADAGHVIDVTPACPEFQVPEVPERVTPLGEPLMVLPERDRLFELYLARVAKAETVNTMRRDAKSIFRDAFFEAKVALDVYLELTK